MCFWCIIFLCLAYLSRAAALAFAFDGAGDGLALGALLGAGSLTVMVGVLLDTGGGTRVDESASDDDGVELLCRNLSRLSRLDIMDVFCGEISLGSADVSEDDTCMGVDIDSDDCWASITAQCVLVLSKV